jgi:Fe2+ transport system protein FeoA
MSIKILSDLKKGEKGRIVKIRGKSNIHHRLMDMGLVAGSGIEMQRVAPLGDPVEIKVKGYNLTLRKEEAACIHVEAL